MDCAVPIPIAIMCILSFESGKILHTTYPTLPSSTESDLMALQLALSMPLL